MSVHRLFPPPPADKLTFSAKIRPSDLAIVVSFTAGDSDYDMVLTPERARLWASWYLRLALDAERAARGRSPKPRWLAWVNATNAPELAHEAGIALTLAETIIQRRDFRQTGGHLVRNGIALHGEVRFTKSITKGDEWVRTWEPKAKPGFTTPEEVASVRGVGAQKLARIQAAGERLRPPHAELAPVVAIGQAT